MLHVVSAPEREMSPAQKRLRAELAELDALLLLDVVAEGGTQLEALLLAPEGLVAVIGADSPVPGALRMFVQDAWMVDGESVELTPGVNPARHAEEVAATLTAALGRNRGLRLPPVRALVSLGPGLETGGTWGALGNVTIARPGALMAALRETLDLPRSPTGRRDMLVGIVDVIAIARSVGVDLSALPSEHKMFRIGFGPGSARLLNLTLLEQQDSILRAMAHSEISEWEQKKARWAELDTQQRVARLEHLRGELQARFQLSPAKSRPSPDTHALRLELLSGTQPLTLALTVEEHECSGSGCSSPVSAQVRGDQRGGGSPSFPAAVADLKSLWSVLEQIHTSDERYDDHWVVRWPGHELPSTDASVRARAARAAQEQKQPAEKKPKWFGR